jgi:carboxyl-terminal processing protease
MSQPPFITRFGRFIPNLLFSRNLTRIVTQTIEVFLADTGLSVELPSNRRKWLNMTRAKSISRCFYGLLLAASVLDLPTVCLGQAREDAKATEPAALTAEQRQRNIESFEVVWRTIRDKHWDPKLGGVDWQAVHDELRPKMDKAASSGQGREITRDMLRRLGHSHLEIIPQEAYRDIDKKTAAADAKGTTDASAGRGSPGFEVRLVDGKATVSKVNEGQAAQKLGVRTGWQVVKVAGEDLSSTLAKVRESNKESHFLNYLLNEAIAERLHGKIGDKVEIVFETGSGSEKSLAIPLGEPPGIKGRFGNLPILYVDVQSRNLPGNIGYFSLSTFLEPTYVMDALGKAVKANLSANGFILDLRGNPGGIGGMAIGVGGWFVNKRDQKLGTLVSRSGSMSFSLNPRVETFDGPLAILVDGLSASTTEILAGGLQDLGRAKVFGTRTAGAALPSQIIRLPNGDGFLFAFANYISAGGKALEGKGVIPDVDVPLRRESLLKGQDAVLDAAIEWIHTRKKPGSNP